MKKFSKEYTDYMNSQAWEDKRQEKLASVNNVCAEVAREKKILSWFTPICTGPLQVHHLTYERLGNERMSDLEVMCRGHHKKHHKHMQRDLYDLRGML